MTPEHRAWPTAPLDGRSPALVWSAALISLRHAPASAAGGLPASGVDLCETQMFISIRKDPVGGSVSHCGQHRVGSGFFRCCPTQSDKAEILT